MCVSAGLSRVWSVTSGCRRGFCPKQTEERFLDGCVLAANISSMCQTSLSKFQHEDVDFSQKTAKKKTPAISLLLKAPRLQRSQASACLLSSCSPSSDAGQLGPRRCVCACERLSVWVCERRNMQRGNKKGVWEGCGENTTTSCPATQAAAWPDFRPHVSPECDLQRPNCWVCVDSASFLFFLPPSFALKKRRMNRTHALSHILLESVSASALPRTRSCKRRGPLSPPPTPPPRGLLAQTD